MEARAAVVGADEGGWALMEVALTQESAQSQHAMVVT
jgi:hypothetical protein